ncbi:hypothetical protein [Pseudogemmobacter bohemicus]|uniref:hypothetical protein n=1 Tax=Pseudogemmobacter bohemicus TaxID=2250708 RepID=UPI0013009367|nr:hypothetical protein [Pseudogemmobacter bohemicus]
MSPNLDRPQLILANRGLMPEQMTQGPQADLFHSTQGCRRIFLNIPLRTEEFRAKDQFTCPAHHMTKIILRASAVSLHARADFRAKSQQNRPKLRQNLLGGGVRENIACKNRDFRILHCGKGALFGNTYFLTQL